MGRAPCCDKASTKRGPWSPDEDAKLKVYIHAHGTGGNWIALPKKANLKRCGKSCRLRWINYLRPDIIHGNFTPEEEETIIDLHEKVGSRWSLIAAKLPRRTDNDIKNFWNTRLKKRVAERQASQQQQQRGYPMRNGVVSRSYPMRSAVGPMFPVMTENHRNPAGEQQQHHTYPMPSAGGATFPDVSEKHTSPVGNQQQQRSYPMPSASGLFPIGVIGQTQPNGLMRPPQMSVDLNNWDQIQYDPERQAALSYQQQFQQQRVAVQEAAQRLRLVQIAQESQQRSPQQFLPGKNEVVSQWLKQQELAKLQELEKQQRQLLPVKDELVSNQPLQSRVNQIENELADLIHPFVSSPQSSTSGCSLTSSGGYESGLSAGGCGSSMTSSGGYETALSSECLGPVPVDQASKFFQMVKDGAIVQKQDSASGSSVTSSDYAGGLGVVLDQASSFYHTVTEGSTIQKQDSEASSTSSEGGCDSRYAAAGGLGAVPDQASNLYDVVKAEVFSDDFLPELISPTTQRGLALGGRDWPTTSEDVLPTYQVQRPSSPIETAFDESLEMETAFAESLEMETVFM